MNIIPSSQIIASGLNAERTRMEAVAENIANANTTRGPDGNPYQRKMVTFEAMVNPLTGDSQGVRVSEFTRDETPGQMVYNPSHPHADEKGMVTMPNVDLAKEMVDLVSASRTYEANLAVMRNARNMANQALSIGR
jgi:flagellar basal-body rod protein FlgC